MARITPRLGGLVGDMRQANEKLGELAPKPEKRFRVSTVKERLMNDLQPQQSPEANGFLPDISLPPINPANSRESEEAFRQQRENAVKQATIYPAIRAVKNIVPQQAIDYVQDLRKPAPVRPLSEGETPAPARNFWESAYANIVRQLPAQIKGLGQGANVAFQYMAKTPGVFESYIASGGEPGGSGVDYQKFMPKAGEKSALTNLEEEFPKIEAAAKQWEKDNPQYASYPPEFNIDPIKAVLSGNPVINDSAYWGVKLSDSSVYSLTTGALAKVSPVTGYLNSTLPMLAEAYQVVLDEGGTPDQARQVALPIALVNGAIEAWVDEKLFSSIAKAPGSAFDIIKGATKSGTEKAAKDTITKEIARQTFKKLVLTGVKNWTYNEIIQVLQEVLQEFSNNFGAWTVNKDVNLLRNLPETASNTLVSSALSGATGAGGEMLNEARNNKAVQTALSELATNERGSINRPEGGGAPGIIGKPTTAFHADPSIEGEYEFEYAVVPLNSPILSNDENMVENPQFPKELQPRSRERSGSVAQVMTIAQKMNASQLLTDTHHLSLGIPITVVQNGKEYMIAGNGRTLGIKKAAAEFQNNFAKYKEALIARAASMGLDPKAIEAMEQPLLVRRLKTPVVNMAEFAKEANASETLVSSPVEAARSDADRLDADRIASFDVTEGTGTTFDVAIRQYKNVGIVNHFLSVIPLSERAGLLARDGGLSKAGIDRIRGAIFAKTFPSKWGEMLTGMFTEETDINIKNIETAIFKAMPHFAKLQAKISSGQIDSSFALDEDIAKAVQTFSELKRSGIRASDYIAQMSMFSESNKLNGLQGQILETLELLGSKPTLMRNFFAEMGIAADNFPLKGQQGMSGFGTISKEGEINAVINRFRRGAGLKEFAVPISAESRASVPPLASTVPERPTESVSVQQPPAVQKEVAQSVVDAGQDLPKGTELLTPEDGVINIVVGHRILRGKYIYILQDKKTGEKSSVSRTQMIDALQRDVFRRLTKSPEVKQAIKPQPVVSPTSTSLGVNASTTTEETKAKSVITPAASSSATPAITKEEYLATDIRKQRRDSAIAEVDVAINRLGRDKVVEGTIIPKGMTTVQWLDSLVARKPTWNAPGKKGQRSGSTGREYLSKPWNVFKDAEGETQLRKAALAYLKGNSAAWLEKGEGFDSPAVHTLVKWEAMQKEKTSESPLVSPQVTPAPIETQTPATEPSATIPQIPSGQVPPAGPPEKPTAVAAMPEPDKKTMEEAIKRVAEGKPLNPPQTTSKTATRPDRIGRKSVITEVTEGKIQTLKKSLIDSGLINDSSYNEILTNAGLAIDKYADDNNFITESDGKRLIRVLNNEAELGYLKKKGEIKASLVSKPNIDKEIGKITTRRGARFITGEDGKKIRILPIVDMRYYTSDLQERTGQPFYEVWYSAREKAYDLAEQAKVITDSWKDTTPEFRKIAADKNALARINQYIASKNKWAKIPYPKGITPDEIKVANAIEQTLLELRPDVRYYRFLRAYNNTNGDTDSIIRIIPDAPKEDIAEAVNILETKGNQALRKYTDSKTWGVIESGYEPEVVVNRDLMRPKPGKTVLGAGHLKTREAIAFDKQDKDILQRATSYVKQIKNLQLEPYLTKINDMYGDSVEKLSDPEAVNRDLTLALNGLKQYGEDVGWLGGLVRGIGRQLLRTRLMLPDKVFRNLLQPFAMDSDRESYIHPANRTLTAEEMKVFENKVSSADSFIQEYLMGNARSILPKSVDDFIDRLNFQPLSERINRIQTFWAHLNKAERALNAYRKDGDVAKFLSSSGLNELQPLQQKHGLELLATNETEAIQFIAREAVNVTHYVYSRADKAPIQMGAVGETLGSLMTYPRSYAQRMAYQGQKLFERNSPTSEKLRAFKVLAGTILFGMMASAIYAAITGKKSDPYNPIDQISWTPGGVDIGATTDVTDLIWTISQAVRGDENALSQLPAKITQAGDAFIPLYEPVINNLEVLTESQQIDRKALRKVVMLLKENYELNESYYKKKRTTIGAIQHSVFGGDSEEAKPAPVPYVPSTTTPRTLTPSYETPSATPGKTFRTPSYR